MIIVKIQKHITDKQKTSIQKQDVIKRKRGKTFKIITKNDIKA